MSHTLIAWLLSLPPQTVQSITDLAKHWLTILPESDLKDELTELLAYADSFTNHTGNYFQFALVPCPNCGNNALETTIHHSTVIRTDDYESSVSDQHAVENVQLGPGFTLICRHCNHMDGQPPTY